MKKYILSFLLSLFFFLSPSFVFAGTNIPVEDVFSDINKDYKYYHEVQELYNRGILFPDSNGKLNPTKLLTRDEFVGISMEVICKKCIQPNTEYQYVEAYTGKKVYFDINERNPYFYCIAEADAKNYVKGYDTGDICQNGVSQADERPFCPDNKITREEAYAVIMRNSKIWTIDDNAKLTEDIKNGIETLPLSDDVFPKNSDGSPYTFYGYFKKALTYQIEEYDENGSPKIYKLLEPKNNKIYPKQYITKEEYIYLAYIALKGNSCKDTSLKNNLALKMKIHDKSCKESDVNCKLSDLQDPEDIYDFRPVVETTCTGGVDNSTGYSRRFINLTTGDKFYKTGKYLDNQLLPSVGERRVYLRVIDKCGGTAEVYSTIYVQDPTTEIPIYPGEDTCKSGDTKCVKQTKCDSNTNKICDVDTEPKTTCRKGIKDSAYERTFTHISSGYQDKRIGKYVDNYNFSLDGLRRIDLTVTDNCGKTSKASTTITIGTTIEIPIYPGEDDCKPGEPDCVKQTRCDSNVNKICDIDTEPKTTCQKGINDSAYERTFTHISTGYQDKRTGKYIDNYNFSLSGLRRIDLKVTDNCGKTARASTTVIIGSQKALNVTILANPIMGYGPLLVSYEGIVTGGTPPYAYNWTFGDGNTGIGKIIENIFQNEGVYQTKLVGTDSEGRSGEATVIIKVLKRDCTRDSDNDGVNDCDDKCPLVAGKPINDGCPIYESRCSASCGCDPGYSCDITDPAMCPIHGICKPIINPGACLYDAGKDTIFGNVTCSSCPCDKFVDFISTLRKCDTVFPAITSPESREIYSRGNLYRISQ